MTPPPRAGVFFRRAAEACVWGCEEARDTARRRIASAAARSGICALTAAIALLLVSFAGLAEAQPAGEGEALVAPGQDTLLAEMLGEKEVLPGGCVFAGGGARGGVIEARYRCEGGEVVLELRHPSAAPDATLRTVRFAVVLREGTPPPGFAEAVQTRILSREAAFDWTQSASPSSPQAPRASPEPGGGSRAVVAAIAVAAALLLAVVAWRAPAMRRRLRAARRRFLSIVRDPWLVALIAILLASAIARAWLGLINWHSNDDHAIVAQMIRDAGWRPPASSLCMECSHAKLYHYTLAAAFSLTRFVHNLEAINPRPVLLVGNLLNWASLSLLLALFWVFSGGDRWSKPVRVLALAFMSFNAGLVGIFSQTTNDGFCILFSALATFALGRFLAAPSLRRSLAVTLFLILAALSKASGWAIFAASLAILLVYLVACGAPRRPRAALATALLVAGFLAVVPQFNPYRDNLASAGTPFVNDAFDAPLMHVEVPRPPSWPLDMFFTFRFLELLRVPYNAYAVGPHPLHRESLWSQIYARTFFLRFDQNIWQSTEPGLLTLGRLCLVLGTLPFAALFAGTAMALRSLWRGLRRRGVSWFADDGDWPHLVFVAVMVAALLALIVEYHRLAILFMWMKAFYLYPAILSFFALFLIGLEALWRRAPRLVTAWMLAMVGASIADLSWLIHDLTVAPGP